MIEGLKFEVTGAEIREALLARHARIKEASKGLIVRPDAEHTDAQAARVLFLADHVVMNETYRLSQGEPMEAGLVRAYHG